MLVSCNRCERVQQAVLHLQERNGFFAQIRKIVRESVYFVLPTANRRSEREKDKRYLQQRGLKYRSFERKKEPWFVLPAARFLGSQAQS